MSCLSPISVNQRSDAKVGTEGEQDRGDDQRRLQRGRGCRSHLHLGYALPGYAPKTKACGTDVDTFRQRFLPDKSSIISCVSKDGKGMRDNRLWWQDSWEALDIGFLPAFRILPITVPYNLLFDVDSFWFALLESYHYASSVDWWNSCMAKPLSDLCARMRSTPGLSIKIS